MANAIPLCEDYGARVRGLIHVGAGVAPEHDLYRAADLDCVVYIDALAEACSIAREKIKDCAGYHVIEALIMEAAGVPAAFHVRADRGHCGPLDLVDPNRTVQERSDALISITLDDVKNRRALAGKRFDLLTIDTPGQETRVLSGAAHLLRSVQFVYLTFPEESVFHGQNSGEETYRLMSGLGFQLAQYSSNFEGQGQMLFRNRKDTWGSSYA
jgi:hypothetical protein